MIDYGQIVHKKNRDLWRRRSNACEEDQTLAARWKGKKKKQFHQKNHGERPNYRNDGRLNNRYEGRSNKRMTKDLTTGSIEDLTEEDKIKDPILRTSDALVAKVMVI